MGLRAGANKASAKKQPYSDFKKKTAKVGRKVKGGNVTKIEVTSKRIQIPLQSQITAVKPENEQENLGLLLKTLQHYSGPARTTALEDLKDLLSTSPSTESYISLIFPSALELLFDDERETRKALIVLLKSLLGRFPSQSFVSIVPVTITYVCSGLTSLNKGVRRDALSLLLAIANMHSHILIPHLEKLISHSLALLVDPSQAGGQDSLGSTSTATFTSSGGSVSKAKLDDSWKKGATNRKPVESTQPSNSQRPPLLVAVLEVIDAILTSASQLSNPETVDSDSCMSLRAGSDSKQAIVLRQIRQCSLYQKGGRVHVKSSSEAGLRDDQSCSLLSSSIIADLCRRLKSVWCGLLLDSSVIAAHTVDVLSLVAKISYRLGEAFHCVRTAEFQALVAGMFFKFPHSSLEASLAAPGSAREKASDLKISIIDLYLCDVALLFYESEVPDSELGLVSQGVSDTRSKVNSYLMQKLQLYVEETARELRNTDDNAMEIDAVDEEKEVKDEQELRTFTTSYSDISVRLFRALEVVTLAAGRNALNTQRADEGESSGWSMSVLLNTLRELMSAFALASAPPSESVPGTGAGIIFSRRSMLATVEPTLKCEYTPSVLIVLYDPNK
jgi:Rix1 complex component involved in 60S ribosome maturation